MPTRRFIKFFPLIFFASAALVAQIKYDEFPCGYSLKSFGTSESTLSVTENQEKIDIGYYGLNLVIHPDEAALDGFIDVTGSILDSTLTALELNLKSTMQVDSVVAGNGRLSFTHSADILAIQLDSVMVAEGYFTVTVYYHGQPVATGLGSFRKDERNGRILISTLSEPFGARDWWPCKDTPADKADSVDIFVTAPSEYVVVSNGLLEGLTGKGAGTQRWHWREGYPIATYLVSLAIYPYYTFQYQYVSTLTGDTLPISYFVYPEDSTKAVEDFSITPEAIAGFEDMFGKYPFMAEKYGMAEFSYTGAMEHQTCTSLGDRLITGQHTYDWIITHELAHQWWGDLITCSDFHHIWLNEGFASYSEALIIEKQGGEAAFADFMRTRFGLQDTWAADPVYRYSINGPGEIFHSTVYKKGAWVLHMLRYVLGDDVFFKILQEYGANPAFAYRTADTEDFQGVCESVSGRNLTWFFQQWIYEPGYPVYLVSFTQADTILTVTVEQTSSEGIFFKMPLQFDVEFPDTVIRFSGWNVNAVQDFTFSVPAGKPASRITLDPENRILKKVDYSGQRPEDFYPSNFTITKIYPNPFNVNTNIFFSLPIESEVEVSIFNLAGEKIWNAMKYSRIGSDKISWNGQTRDGIPAASGVYVVEVRAGMALDRRKILYLK